MSIDEHMRATYAKRIATYEQQQTGYTDRWHQLEDLLLAHGGEAVVPHLQPDPNLARLLAGPLDVAAGPAARQLDGEPSNSHAEAGYAWLTGDIDVIVTGYALSRGLWVEHTWGRDTTGIVEPTYPRDMYAGVRLDDVDACRFMFANTNPVDIDAALDDPARLARLMSIAEQIDRLDRPR